MALHPRTSRGTIGGRLWTHRRAARRRAPPRATRSRDTAVERAMSCRARDEVTSLASSATIGAFLTGYFFNTRTSLRRPTSDSTRPAPAAAPFAIGYKHDSPGSTPRRAARPRHGSKPTSPTARRTRRPSGIESHRAHPNLFLIPDRGKTNLPFAQPRERLAQHDVRGHPPGFRRSHAIPAELPLDAARAQYHPVHLVQPEAQVDQSRGKRAAEVRSCQDGHSLFPCLSFSVAGCVASCVQIRRLFFAKRIAKHSVCLLAYDLNDGGAVKVHVAKHDVSIGQRGTCERSIAPLESIMTILAWGNQNDSSAAVTPLPLHASNITGPGPGVRTTVSTPVSGFRCLHVGSSRGSSSRTRSYVPYASVTSLCDFLCESSRRVRGSATKTSKKGSFMKRTR